MLHIVVPYWNAAPYIEECINSVKRQTVTDWRCYLLNSLSTDRSSRIAQAVTKDDNRFRLFHSLGRTYVPGNYAFALDLAEIADEDVVVCLDGDDYFSNEWVLSNVTEAYRDPAIWLTWGSYANFVDGPHGERILRRGVAAGPVDDVTKVRSQRWQTSHLRTFKAFLFRAIKPADLKSPTGQYWETAGDMALMFPMLEMATNEHAKYLKAVHYIYRADNPNSDHRLGRESQLENERLLRAMPRYSPLRRG